VKVVHLSTVHTVGDSRILEKEAPALLDAGWEVTVVLPNEGDETRHGVKIRGVSKPAGRLVRATITTVKVVLKGLQERGDVYHFHDPELLFVGVLLQSLGKKVVYDVHETHSASVAHRPYLPRVVRAPLAWLVRKLEIAAAKRFAGIVAATPAIGEQFAAVKTPRVVVQNFPQLDGRKAASRPRVHKQRATAIYMGALSEGRGLITMVQAMELLPVSLEATLTLAGNLAPALLERIRVQPGYERVRLTGRLSRAELDIELDRATVGLVVLHPEPNYVNSFPTKMFEYMAAGLPVIASDFPVWRSILTANRCGLLVDPLDIRQIANALEYLIANETEAKEMGERGIELVRSRYNWGSEREKLIAFYNRFRQSPGLVAQAH